MFFVAPNERETLVCRVCGGTLRTSTQHSIRLGPKIRLDVDFPSCFCVILRSEPDVSGVGHVITSGPDDAASHELALAADWCPSPLRSFPLGDHYTTLP